MEPPVGSGLGVTELLLYRFLHGATAGQPDSSLWPEIWQLNGLQDDRQTGQTALRYSLAYAGYAAATLATARTPAYLEPASQILKSVFDRLLQHRVWAYWDIPGRCGQPWVKDCVLFNHSMADLQADSYGWLQSLPNTSLDDPVASGNIMLSAHVASIGLLYEALSGDETLSREGE